MTPREIILANIAHADPDRPGLNFDNDRINDILYCRVTAPSSFTSKRWTEGNKEFYDDMWGNIWVRMKEGCQSGEIYQPVLSDWSKLDHLQIPDFSDQACYAQIQETFSKPTDRFKLVDLPGWIFASARYLRRMDQYFMDMVEHPSELKKLHEILAGAFELQIQRIGELGADGFFFCEDMGIQDRLLFSPAMWQEYFGKLYQRLFGQAHDLGMKVFMHSCGYNWDILPDLLEAGVDCFQFDQPTIYNMPLLAKLLKKHQAALWSPVDIQKILPTGDRVIIQQGAHEMVRIFRGGLICKNYPDLPGIGVKEEWDMWAYQAILEEAGLC